MPFEIITKAHPEDVIAWLQEYVGELLWSKPIIEWHGKGWCINSYGLVSNRGKPSSISYIIKIDNPKLATLAALRWQG